MGNEVSHSTGVKQSVGGGGKVGQFHRVLVESDYAVPDLREPVVTDDIHQQETLNKREVESVTELKADHNSEKEKKQDASGDSEYSLIEECKALISEAADRAVQRSISRTSKGEQVTDIDEIRTEEALQEVHIVDQAKSASVLHLNQVLPGPSSENTYSNIDVDKNEVEQSEVKRAKVKSEIAETVKRSEVDTSYALKCGILTGSNEDIFEKRNKEKISKKQNKKSKSTENIFQREVIESVKEHFQNENTLEKEENQTFESKRSKDSFIAKMFKFSKRKPRADANVSADIKTPVRDEIVEEISQESNAQPVKSDESDQGNTEQSNKRNHEIRRLNSLDSGIVVDKCSDNANNGSVEYAVVQKTKKKIKDLIKTNDITTPQSKADDSENIVTQEKEVETVANIKVDTKSKQTEEVYINGDKTDEDFVYINERAVDVDGLDGPSEAIVSETLSPVSTSAMVNKSEEKHVLDDEQQSTVSNDSGTSSGSIIRRSDMLAPDKSKLKKKSWSFQLGGKKKPSDDMESHSVVSMDPNASNTVEPKKSRWKFGKFSFRKGSDDVSSSTPNLHKAGIPEDGHEVVMRKHSDDKKKTKLKKIKAKKEKKRSPKKNSSSLDQRSISMIEIGQGESLAPRNRRSIVEEDLNFTQTDVFEGVSLSDLSQDEEAEVSTNPAGGKGDEKKGSKMKEDTTIIDKIKSAVVNKTEKIAKQKSLELPTIDTAVNQKTDTSKLEKSDSVEDKIHVTHAELSENIESKLKESSSQEHVEGEYVNIVSTKLQTVHNAPKSNENNDIVADDVEYAQVVKTKVKEVHENIDETKQTFQSCVPEQMLKLDTAKVLNAEINETDSQSDVTETNEKLKFENTDKETLKEEETDLKSRGTAFSNMIYSDEEFTAKLAGKIETKTDCGNEDENDAYVEIQEIVDNIGANETSKEQVDEKNEIKIKPVDLEDSVKEIGITESAVVIESADITIQEKKVDVSDNVEEVVVEELVIDKTDFVKQESETGKPDIEEMVKQSVKKVEGSLMILPDSSPATRDADTDIQQTVIKTNKEGSVIVLKDVGVQVPDIYMPLDKEKDFGFTANNIPCVSIGIQVTDKDLDIEHVVVSMNKEDDKENVSPAYF
ncbi:titin-like isoform X2 [Ruditapes philippinarum]|nr:titin-like isoform X2 [Ruditapes philippinarum]